MTSLRYGSAPARRARILELVVEQGFCSTAELTIGLGVSDMTIRRDANRLAEEGHVRVVHGGVSSLPPAALEGSGDFESRARRMASAKKSVGLHAAALVRAGETIAIDAGTTLNAMARALPLNLAYTVVSNSVAVIQAMLDRPAARLVCLGGEMQHATQSVSGPATMASIANLHVDTLFLAASGVTPRGIFCGNDFDAVTKRALVGIADRVVLVVDSSKFRTTAMVRVCGLDAIDLVIIDDKIDSEHELLLLNHGIEVMKAHADRLASVDQTANQLSDDTGHPIRSVSATWPDPMGLDDKHAASVAAHDSRRET